MRYLLTDIVINMEAIALISLLAFCQISFGYDTSNYRFPDDFQFGVATAAYQVEGAWDEENKGESIWDHLTHTNPSFISDLSNGDIACNSYHKWAEDASIMKELGVNYYRFSISWPRILPNGLPYSVNQKGIDHYHQVIDNLLENGITPMVTLYHWDLPQYLQELGGFLNPAIVDYFRDYADVVFKNFGDKVKLWSTFNEPRQVCLEGYGMRGMAPALNKPGTADYQCTHNLLKAHAAAYHLFDDKYRSQFGGKVGIVIDSSFIYPQDGSDVAKEQADRDMQFNTGWYAHPIFSTEGNYPQVMIDRIAERSRLEGFSVSRLPAFTPEEVEYIRGTADYYGLNHYSSYQGVVQGDSDIGSPSWYNDKSTSTTQDDWVQADGFRQILKWIRDNYQDPEIIVTENGCSDSAPYDDGYKINYLRQYQSALLDAIHEDGVKVIAYTVWSLLDNFEWGSGYTMQYGVVRVDFTNPGRPRSVKKSGEYYKQVIATRCVTESGQCG